MIFEDSRAEFSRTCRNEFSSWGKSRCVAEAWSPFMKRTKLRAKRCSCPGGTNGLISARQEVPLLDGEPHHDDLAGRMDAPTDDLVLPEVEVL